MIHPTAIVEPGAVLAEGVSIGAYSIVGANVKIGPGTTVGPHVVLAGRTTIGAQNRIFQFCSIGDAPQHLHYRGEDTALEIGDGNTLREYCTVNRGSPSGAGVTRIGNGNFIMAYCHVAHDCQVGNEVIFANGASLAGHVVVEDHAVLGGFTMVHQYCRVGAHCMTGISTVTFKDIPPYLLVAGNTAQPHGVNFKGLVRRGFDEARVRALRRAYRTLYHENLRLAEALDELDAVKDSPEVQHLVAFIRGSQRGIIR